MTNSFTGKQMILIAGVALALAFISFQAGRKSVDAAKIAERATQVSAKPRDLVVAKEQQSFEDDHKATVRNIATVPFSELYDVLRSASHEQIVTWGKDLELMPYGPRRTLAVIAFYKCLIQVDHDAAIDLILHTKNGTVCAEAIESVLKSAPESIWGELTEMMDRLPRGRSTGYRQDPIWFWSRVDPVAVSKYIEQHPAGDGQEQRVLTLLGSWGESDPVAARKWMDEDASRQTSEAIMWFLSGLESNNRMAAVDYAVANAGQRNFTQGIDNLAYDLLCKSSDDARAMILQLPLEQARAALENIRYLTTGVFVGENRPEQKPPEYVASWMTSLPPNLWQDQIGDVVADWLKREDLAATSWLNSLRPDIRDLALADLCGSHVKDRDYDVSPDRVVELGFTITDSKLREDAFRKFVTNLGENSKQRLDRVDEMQLSHDQKSFLQKLAPQK